MRASAVALAALVLAAALPAAASAPDAAVAEDAARWFRASVQGDGRLGDHPAEAAAGNVAWVAAGIAATSQDLSGWSAGGPDAVAWWRANVASGVREGVRAPNPCADAERSLLGVVGLGEDPASFGGYDLLARVESCYRGDGLWDDPVSTQDTSWDNNDAYGVLALRAAGVPPSDERVVDTVERILARQNADGGWNFAAGTRTSAVDDTAQTLVALLSVVPADDVGVQRGLAYLSAVQLPTGGFRYDKADESGDSAAEVMQAVLAAGEDPDAGRWRKPGGSVRSDLLTFRNADGGFAPLRGGDSNELTTQAAMRVLAGGVLPVVPPAISLTATPATVGRPVALRASAEVPVGGVAAWSWDLGDGTQATGAAVTHTFEHAGATPVRVTAITDHGARATADFVLDVRPAPSFALDLPAQALRGEGVTATVAGASRLRVDWGDGNASGWVSGAATHAYARLGVYDVRVDTPEAYALRALHVVNSPPALAAAATLVGDRTRPVELVAEASDADGPTPGVRWRFGDVVLDGARASFAAPDLGTFRGEVTAVDADGAVARHEVVVRIENLAPTLRLEADDAVEGAPATVRAVADDPDGGAPRVVWDDGTVGDARIVDTSAPGERRVSARALDADGGLAEAAVVVLVRDADAPAPTGTPLSAAAGVERPPALGDPVTLGLRTAGGTPPYAWRVQVEGADVPVVDGTADLGIVERPLAWSAWVRDADGNVRSLSGVVRPLPNRPPTARLAVAAHGADVVADATASADPEGRALLYRFRWGDGEIADWSPAARASHAYDGAGTYEVVVEVRDAVDALARAAASVLVSVGDRADAVPPAAVLEVARAATAPADLPALALAPSPGAAVKATPAASLGLVALLGAALLRTRRGA